MQLILTEDQELLAKTAADFVAENSPVARVRALRDANDPDGFSRALWREMNVSYRRSLQARFAVALSDRDIQAISATSRTLSDHIAADQRDA